MGWAAEFIEQHRINAGGERLPIVIVMRTRMTAVSSLAAEAMGALPSIWR